MSRIAPALDDLIGIEDPDDLMVEIIDLLSESGTPQAGNYYTFVYRPKTSGIRYDQNPLVAVTNVYSWGFVGVNFHWGESRSYTFNEVVEHMISGEFGIYCFFCIFAHIRIKITIYF